MRAQTIASQNPFSGPYALRCDHRDAPLEGKSRLVRPPPTGASFDRAAPDTTPGASFEDRFEIEGSAEATVS